MLKEGLAAFRRAATYDEYYNQGFDAGFTRAFIDGTWSLIGLVAVTIVLRKIIGYFALTEKRLGFTYLSAYLEVLWMTTVSVFPTNKLSAVQDWALTRRGIAPAYRQYEELKVGLEESAGPLYSSYRTTSASSTTASASWAASNFTTTGLAPSPQTNSPPTHLRFATGASRSWVVSASSARPAAPRSASARPRAVPPPPSGASGTNFTPPFARPGQTDKFRIPMKHLSQAATASSILGAQQGQGHDGDAVGSAVSL